METLIWLTEVAPQLGKAGERFLEELAESEPGSERDRFVGDALVVGYIGNGSPAAQEYYLDELVVGTGLLP